MLKYNGEGQLELEERHHVVFLEGLELRPLPQLPESRTPSLDPPSAHPGGTDLGLELREIVLREKALAIDRAMADGSSRPARTPPPARRPRDSRSTSRLGAEIKTAARLPLHSSQSARSARRSRLRRTTRTGRLACTRL